MKMARKIRLLPTYEQEKLFFWSAGTALFAHNYFVQRMKEQSDPDHHCVCEPAVW